MKAPKCIDCGQDMIQVSDTPISHAMWSDSDGRECGITSVYLFQCPECKTIGTNSHEKD